MTDRLTMVTELGSLATEATLRGDDRAVAILRRAAEHLMAVHSDLLKIEDRKRRDRERSPGKLPAHSPLREAVWLRDKGLCVLCGIECRRFKNHRYDTDNSLGHIDHVTPVVRGGTNVFENLRLLCKGCHDPKSATERRGSE